MVMTGWNQAESGLRVVHARAVAEMGGARCLTEAERAADAPLKPGKTWNGAAEPECHDVPKRQT
jgi:hypothetical protein